jgi:hypothetical protein
VFTGVCMTPAERAEWDKHNKDSGPYRAESPCEDCTVTFYNEMVAAGTCDGHPKGFDPRNIRAGVKARWEDKEWAAARRAEMSKAATVRNKRMGQLRRRKSKYAGMRCQNHPCRMTPVSTSSFSGKMLCRKHTNLEAYHRNK